MADCCWIDLIEYTPRKLSADTITYDFGYFIWRNHNKHVAIEFPSPKTEGNWQLTAQGWVGFIPLSPELGLRLEAKVPLQSIFGMFEYAYKLNSFSLLDGLIQCNSLQEFYNRIAIIFARRVLERTKKGLYREYRTRKTLSGVITGKINLAHLMSKPWEVNKLCEYENHQSDIEDNQLLTWSLYTIIRSKLCNKDTLTLVYRAFRALNCHTSLVPFSAKDCVKRLYNRLNNDYSILHSLCRFFLEQSGPSHTVGEYKMIPFLFNMARLYELFVAEWLRAHLPQTLELKSQEHIVIGDDERINFSIDLSIYEKETHTVRYILDTKYKTSSLPEPADIAQVVTYALAKNCKEAILVYPFSEIVPIDEYIGDVRVRSLSFEIGSDLDSRGNQFLQRLCT